MIKRFFDVLGSFCSLLLFGWIIVLSYFVATLDNRSSGFFLQKRVGQYGRPFTIIKIKTMKEGSDGLTTISRAGSFFRRTKIDELPQLINIFIGEMSFVGPRPDIEGYYNTLKGEDLHVLELKPGLTSEASIKYFNEENLLKQKQNPKHYNDAIIFPDKVKLNLQYYYHNSILGDLKIIWKTILRYIK